TIFYLKFDEAWRPYQVWKHVLGEKTSSDELVMEEKDPKFRVDATRSRSGDYVFFNIGSATTDEVWFLSMDKLKGSAKRELKCVAKREQNVEYSVAHHGQEFLILTNKDNATNFKLMTAPCSDPGNWKEVIPHSKDLTLLRAHTFKDFVVIEQRGEGLSQFRIRYKSGVCVCVNQ
ncbi:Peptidase S9, prolyl oligopeptidase active site region, partial [Reticulomyxa filosa]